MRALIAMNETLVLPMICLLTAIFISWIGWAIGPKKMHYLIAGWNPDAVTDHDAFGNTIARGLFEGAAVMAVAAALAYFSIVSIFVAGIVFAFVPMFPIVFRLIQAKRKYTT